MKSTHEVARLKLNNIVKFYITDLELLNIVQVELT